MRPRWRATNCGVEVAVVAFAIAAGDFFCAADARCGGVRSRDNRVCGRGGCPRVRLPVELKRSMGELRAAAASLGDVELARPWGDGCGGLRARRRCLGSRLSSSYRLPLASWR